LNTEALILIKYCETFQEGTMESAEQNITLKVKLNREDVSEMNRLYLKALQNRRWSWKRFVIALVVILAMLLLLYVLNLFTASSASVSSDFNHIITPILLLCLAYVILYVIYKLGMPVLAAKSGEKQYDSNKILQKDYIYTVSAEGITSETESAIVKLKYDEIYKVMETVNYLFLYESTQMAMIIPKRCFTSPEHQQQTIRILKEHLPMKKYEVYHF
jgi:hypothetical protein